MGVGVIIRFAHGVWVSGKTFLPDTLTPCDPGTFAHPDTIIPNAASSIDRAASNSSRLTV
jgi:hypothetical protein